MINNTIVKLKLPTMFSNEVLVAAQKHAEKEYPNEVVGLVDYNEKYIPLRNHHPEPKNNWRIHPRTLVSHMKKGIKAVIHSHTNDIWAPSKKDMEAQIRLNIPFGIIICNKNGAGNVLWWGDQVPKIPLLGRPYISGVYDCYSIIRDYYYEKGIYLNSYPHNDEWWEYEHEENFIVKNFEKENFIKLDTDEKPKEGDVFIMKLRSKVPNHCGLYTGGDNIIHHLSNVLSRTDSASRLAQHTQFILRHKDWV